MNSYIVLENTDSDESDLSIQSLAVYFYSLWKNICFLLRFPQLKNSLIFI